MADERQAREVDMTKRHFSAMLKHLPGPKDEAKAVEVVKGHLRLFAGKEWEPVKAKLRLFANEDPLRVVGKRRPARLLPAGRPLLTTSASAPPAVLADTETPPAGLPRLSTASSLLSGRSRAPSTPRERWDVTSRSPATPLSPTTTGNAFASGGYWEKLTPKTPATQTPPLTAIPPSPYSPVVPQDHEARAAYDQVKADVEAMARTICANRMSVHSKISNSDHVPNALLKPRDLLRGAEITLRYRQVNLAKTIDPDLPKTLNNLANEEKKILELYSVKNGFELLDLDMWLRVDTQNLNFTTILDVQREMLHMHRNRRKSKLLSLSDQAVQQAWATRILEDAKHTVDADDGASYSSDETNGYEYGNFMRSIKHGGSSGSELASKSGGRSYMSLASMRSSASASNSDSLGLTRENTWESSKRSSPSPIKHRKNSLPFRSREGSLSDHPSPDKTRTSAIAGTRGVGRLSTTTRVEEEDEKPQLSPADRASRRKGATPTELNAWAKQLKEMQDRQDRKRSVAELHPALRQSDASTVALESTTPSTSHPSTSTQPYNLPPPPQGFKYTSGSYASLHDAVRRKQHVRSKSSIARDEWRGELEKMERREQERQMEESRKNGEESG
ncbi:hypothetical protein BDU57DRAFT_539858 [Ampelomyces quisqualis]|uniref:Uncharacterized protein n=1 Tax=Ampelomyces quisqualis TaxID=50730 RepID=A0A6A5QJC9_AMPQU|nr:hypothetical protein BDU57DRAFT_539858 [Ampelomyces quisqualis]